MSSLGQLIVRPEVGFASRPRLVNRSGEFALIVLGTLLAIGSAASAAIVGTLALIVPIALVGLIAAIAFPPVLVACFVFIPYFESAPVVSMIPFDPTVTLGAILLAVYGHRLATHRVALLPAGFIAPMLVVGLALSIGLVGTPAPEYGTEKVLKFFTVTLIAAVAPFFVIRTRSEVVRFLWAIAGGGVLVAAVTPFVEPTLLPGLTTEYSLQGRYSFGGQIFPARFLCTAALILLVLPGFTQVRWRHLAPVAAVGVIFVALGFGARGPIGAFAAALLAIVLLSAVQAPRQLLLLLLVVTLGGVVMPFITLPGQSSERLAAAVTDPVGVLRSDTRSAVYNQALRLTADQPLTGIGTGGFSIYTAVVTPSRFRLDYPHNIFLELTTDAGIVPAIALLLPILAGSALLLRRVRISCDGVDRNLSILVMGLLLLNFLASQFSGDINDNRTLWLFLALAWLIGRDGFAPESARAAAARR